MHQPRPQGLLLDDFQNGGSSGEALISGHPIPGGLTPGTYGGIARDCLLLSPIFGLGSGALDRFSTSEARYTGLRPAGFVTSKMKDPDHGDWVYSPVW